MKAFDLRPPCHSTRVRHGPLTALAASGFVPISLTNASSFETVRPFSSFSSTFCMARTYDVCYISVAELGLGRNTNLDLSQHLRSLADRLKLCERDTSILHWSLFEGPAPAARVKQYF